jgi:glutamate-5-semialdehyde dehydrogenase
MEGLVIYKYILTGHGDMVADYSGSDAKSYTHTELDRNFDDVF